MYGNKSIKHKPDGTKYKDFFYYGCKHRTMTRGHKCEYKKQINEELLDSAVAEVIIKLVSNPKFAAMMQQKINMKIDTSAIEQEIANYEKQLRQSYATKSRFGRYVLSHISEQVSWWFGCQPILPKMLETGCFSHFIPYPLTSILPSQRVYRCPNSFPYLPQ